jgi:1-deoxy-D-xylulose-5-phosphate reductoisomerase
MKEADIVLIAISGTIAILPLIAAIRNGKRIALANKEAIVSGGAMITDLARSRNAEIIPVDSEHNSIFQCIKGEKKEEIKKVFLIGSGGPLKNISKNLFSKLKPSMVLKHPVWKMGQKISVDSATMMNKGLEVIEASHLFGIDVSKIEVLIHKEAYMHSIVQFVDGNFMANLFYPDMRMPIFYAFNYPKRNSFNMKKLDFSKIKSFSFEEPNNNKFPALNLCYKIAKKEGTYTACLNAANEEAVNSYLEGKITFPGIVETVQKVILGHKSVRHPSVDEILYTDKWAKEEVKRITG